MKRKKMLDEQERLEKEREEHERRLEAENRKRRVMPAARGGNVKLRRVGLKAMGFDDAEEENVGEAVETGNDSISNPSNPKKLSQEGPSAAPSSGGSDTGTSASTLSTEELSLILQTAAWVADHPEQAQGLSRRAQQEKDKRFDFLLDSNRFTAAGKKYREELERCRAERSSRAVFADANKPITQYQHPTVPGVPSTSTTVTPTAVSVNAAVAAAALAANLSVAATVNSAKLAVQPCTMSVSASTTTSMSIAPSASMQSTSSVGCSAEERRKERKNRWGPAPASVPIATTVVAPASATIQTPDIVLPSAEEIRQRLGPVLNSINAAVGASSADVVTIGKEKTSSSSSAVGFSSSPRVPSTASSSTSGKQRKKQTDITAEAEEVARLYGRFDNDDGDRDERFEAQVREQKQLQLLESRIREAVKGSAVSSHIVVPSSYGGGSAGVPMTREEELYQERLQQYNELAANFDETFRDTVDDAERSGGVIDGGTWEHRKRAKEMLETAAKNLELTARAAGRHHIADFLPVSLCAVPCTFFVVEAVCL
jgi:hypothetical protein